MNWDHELSIEVSILAQPDRLDCLARVLGRAGLDNYRPEKYWAVLAQPDWPARSGWTLFFYTLFMIFWPFFYKIKGLGRPRCVLGQTRLRNMWPIKKIGWPSPVLQFGPVGWEAWFDNSRCQIPIQRYRSANSVNIWNPWRQEILVSLGYMMFRGVMHMENGSNSDLCDWFVMCSRILVVGLIQWLIISCLINSTVKCLLQIIGPMSRESKLK